MHSLQLSDIGPRHPLMRELRLTPNQALRVTSSIVIQRGSSFLIMTLHPHPAEVQEAMSKVTVALCSSSTSPWWSRVRGSNATSVACLMQFLGLLLGN